MPRRRKQSSGIWIFLLILLLLIAAFVGAILYTWDMPPPLRTIQKILPPSAFEGVNVVRPVE